MILNNTQLQTLKAYNKHVAEGMSQSAAAEAVDVSRSTIRRWLEADNASAAKVTTSPQKETKKASKAPKVKKPRVSKPKTQKLKDAAPGKNAKLTLSSGLETALSEYWLELLTEIQKEPSSSPLSNFTGDFDEFDFSADVGDFLFNIENVDEEKVTDLQQKIENEGLLTGDSTLADLVAQLEPFFTVNESTDDQPVADEMVDFQCISLPKTLNVVREGAMVAIDKTHQNFEAIKKIISEQSSGGKIAKSALTKIFNLMDLKSAISDWSNGRITVTVSGSVTVDGKPLNNKLSQFLVRLVKSGKSELVDRFVKFHDKVEQALSFKVTNRLFDFLNKNSLALDAEGNVLCYKVVRSNFFDKHSGTFDNSPGKTPEMSRNKVDDQDSNTCSNGLHVAAADYIKSFGSRSNGDRVVEVSVDPRDWVSVPIDYNGSKARVCKYFVVREVTGKELDAVWSGKDFDGLSFAYNKIS